MLIPRPRLHLLRLLCLFLLAALAVAVASYAAFVAAHVFELLRLPFPLDYGEGPLLAQVRALAGGTPVWRLYADPAKPPFLVVNYPPVYMLLSAALSFPLGGALLAGRVVALLATLATLGALAVLLRQTTGHRQSRALPPSSFLLPPSSFAFLLLTVPIIREWVALMRVDMLALALGLWGLVLMGRITSSAAVQRTRWIQYLAPGILFVLALYTKPSMVAAPLAGSLWLLFGRWANLSLATRFGVALAWGLLAALPLALLQWASDGWFWVHVVWANANRWDAALASQIWADQLRLRWPLFAAGALGALICLFELWKRCAAASQALFVVPLAYALGALVAAIGVGKVGAAANYFLELYVALVWLAGVAFAQLAASKRAGSPQSSLILLLLLLTSTARYSPVWSKDQLKLAGLLAPNPPRLAWGRYGLWSEAAREGQVLAAMGRAQALIDREVRGAGGAVFTDMPGFAAHSGALAPLQVFEHRQLMDTGHWDQRPLLAELANGALPLAVLDYLGNWITPEIVAVFAHRYGQDGSLGPFDIYRPIDPGLSHPANTLMGSLRLVAYRLVPPPAPATTYAPGALLVPTVEWQRAAPASDAKPLSVAFVLHDKEGKVAAESVAPLLYGAFPPSGWPEGAPVQHMQPFALPESLPAGRYTLLVTLRANGADVAPPQPLTQLWVAPDGGRRFETGYYVPGALLAAWERLGGVERAGYPLTPAVPFAWGTLQCFERACLEQRGDAITQRPLGELLYAAETLRADPPAPLLPAFADYAQAQSEDAALGEPLSGPVERNGYTVQWTRYARLERDPATGAVGLGRLGDDALRLPIGTSYRWGPFSR